MPDIKSQNLNAFYNTSPVQYVIPPYQRTITWPADQWAALLNDVFYVSKDPLRSHLIQMIQLQANKSGTRIAVGDGQQRFVHTSLILMAVAHALKEISQSNLIPEKYETLLESTCDRILPEEHSASQGMLSFVIDGRRHPKIKVAPTNEKAYEAIVLWKTKSLPTEKSEKCIVQHAFEYYKNTLTDYLVEKDSKGATPTPIEINNRALTIITTIENKLVFATAYFDQDESMQASYENTNSRSVALTESELIKNHIFKHFDPLAKQEDLVKKYWDFFDTDYWIYKDLGDRNLYEKNSPRRPNVDRLDLLFHYHIIATTGKFDFPDKSGTNKTFKSFKRLYEEKTDKLIQGVSKTQEKQKILSDFYENLLGQLYQEAQFYSFLEKGTPDSKDNFDIRAKDFYHRVIVCCNFEIGFSILLALKSRRDITYAEFNEVLNIIEGFILRKQLSEEAVTAALSRTFLPYIKAKKLDAQKMRNDLLKNSSKRGSWVGDADIIKYQLEKLWTSKEHALAKLLITDFENSERGLAQTIPYGVYTLEHFMPQKINDPKISWPLKAEEEHLRNNLKFNLGNFFLLTEEMNIKLGNKPFKEKIGILGQHVNKNNSLGFVSLDYAYHSAHWDKERILKHTLNILKVILEKYEGPARTANQHPCTPLLVDNILSPQEKIYYLDDKFNEFVAVVHEDGTLFYKGESYTSFIELTKKIDPTFRGKDCLPFWKKKIGSQYLPISK